MHLYISVSYFVCAVSLTHSLWLNKPHLARHKYIISRRLHWMPFKLELFSRENDVFTRDWCHTVSVRVAVTSLPAPLVIKGSARNRQDVRLTGWSPIRAGHARNRLIPGRSIGASLVLTHTKYDQIPIRYAQKSDLDRQSEQDFRLRRDLHTWFVQFRGPGSDGWRFAWHHILPLSLVSWCKNCLSVYQSWLQGDRN